jgi:succinate-acetate transporter protein
MAVGNTFGATALSSYGGFWIAFAIILTPGFGVGEGYAEASVNAENYALGYFLAGWFIFTTILLLCTLRSTVAFFLLFFFLDLAFLFLFLAHLYPNAQGQINTKLNQTGGYFGLFAAFMAWYNALAGIADSRFVSSDNVIRNSKLT